MTEKKYCPNPDCHGIERYGNYCRTCGTKLEIALPPFACECGQILSENDVYCQNCGKKA